VLLFWWASFGAAAAAFVDEDDHDNDNVRLLMALTKMLT
jgi:hypothetical protein